MGDTVPVQNGEERTARLLDMLSSLTEDDLLALDQEIRRVEARLAQLRHVRKIAGVGLGESPPKPGPRPKAEGNGVLPSGKLERMADARRRVVRHIAEVGHAVRTYDIITACKVAPKQVKDLLDHPWFQESPQGIHITPLARQEVLD